MKTISSSRDHGSVADNSSLIGLAKSVGIHNELF